MIGRTLSYFRITAKMGEGGMGVVYRAEDPKLGREVAIKVLPEAVASDPERLARFKREAQVLASLNHPHIASIYQVEEDGGVHFLVMELIEGEDLAQRIEEGSIPVREALGIAAQVADALEAAHEKGVVHRDLKPANIKVTPEGRGSMPFWSPDGSEIAYASKRAGSWNLYRAAVDGSDTGDLLLDREREQWTGSWSPDGTILSYYEVNPEAGRDIWVLPLDGGEPVPFIATPFNERSPRFSPDGKWIAYVSNDSGRDEVHVVPYPRAEGKWTISTEGGSEPLWSPGGTELFYRQGDRMMGVQVENGTSFAASRPSVLFEGRYEKEVAGNPNYDISPDGTRFLMIKRSESSAATRIRVILDWLAELEP